MKGALAALAAVVLATAGLTYYLVTRNVDAEALAQELKLSRLEGRLEVALASGAAAESISQARKSEIDTLRARGAQLLAAGQRPGPLPPAPLQPAPDTCAPWIGRLTAEVADLTRRTEQLQGAALSFQAGETRATARAEDLSLAHRRTLDELRIVRDSLADRPGPRVPNRPRERLRLIVDAQTTLEGAQLLAGVRRGALYGGVRQSLRYGETGPPGDRALVVGFRREF